MKLIKIYKSWTNEIQNIKCNHDKKVYNILWFITNPETRFNLAIIYLIIALFAKLYVTAMEQYECSMCYSCRYESFRLPTGNLTMAIKLY